MWCTVKITKKTMLTTMALKMAKLIPLQWLCNRRMRLLRIEMCQHGCDIFGVFFLHSLLYFVKNNFFPVARPLRLLLSFATLCYFFFSIVARQSFSSECREHKSGSSTRVLCVYMHDFAMLSIIQTIQNCLSKWWKSTAMACEQRYKRTTTNDK